MGQEAAEEHVKNQWLATCFYAPAHTAHVYCFCCCPHTVTHTGEEYYRTPLGMMKMNTFTGHANH
jgi:hypothetical protein